MPLLDFIARYLGDLFNRIYGYLFSTDLIPDKLDPNQIKININYKNVRNVLLTLTKSDTVGYVKEILSKKLALPADDLKIIFCGKELDNSTKIEDYDLSHCTTVHVILRPSTRIQQEERRSSKDDRKDEPPVPDEDGLPPLSSKDSHFFVYCSTCKKVGPGKLRVRCEVCKQGAFTLKKGPGSWEDLQPQTLLGQCHSPECEGLDESFAQFYFVCGASPHGHTPSREEVIPLPLIRQNTRNKDCLVCLHQSSPILVFPCQSSHVVCLDCFGEYAKSRLDERNFVHDPLIGYTLGCPGGCENSLIKEIHHFRILDSHQYERYQRFGAEDCLRLAGGIQCPRPGCGVGYIIESSPIPGCDKYPQKVTCDAEFGCGYVFCSRCLQGYHLGECERVPTINNRSVGSYQFLSPGQPTANVSWDAASADLIRNQTKPCPSCRAATEKDGGCNHMTCIRCRFDWCWRCQDVWKNHCMATHWFGS